MGHSIDEIKNELHRANNNLSDSQSAADGAACAAEEAYSYASDAQSSAEEASTYADDAQAYISSVLDMLDDGIEGNEEEISPAIQQSLNHLNEKVTAVAALVNDSLTALNGILLDLNNQHLPLDPNTFTVTHRVNDTEDAQETTPEEAEV